MTPSALLLALCLLSPLCLTGVAEGWGGFTKTPTESECRPFIEKALKEQQPADNPQEAVDATSSEQLTTPQSVQQEGSIEETEEATTKESIEGGASNETQPGDEGGSVDTETTETTESVEDGLKDNAARSEEGSLGEEAAESIEAGVEETGPESTEEPVDQPSVEDGGESAEKGESIEPTSTEAVDAASAEQSAEAPDDSTKEASEEDAKSLEDNASLEQEVESVLETEEAREVGSEDGATATELVNEKPEETEETAEESAEKSDISREALSEDQAGEESIETPIGEEVDSVETTESAELKEPEEATEDTNETVEENKESAEETKESEDAKESVEDTKESIEYTKESIEDTKESIEDTKESIEDTKESIEDTKETVEDTKISLEDAKESTEESKEALAEEPTEEKESAEESDKTETSGDASTETVESSAEASSETKEESSVEAEVSNDTLAATPASGEESIEQAATESTESGEEEKSAEEEPVKESEPTDEDQLTLEFETPKVRRPRDHITDILRLSPEAAETETLLAKTIDSTLKDLKRLYDAAIKPLELLFKYRDLSNRHFGDPEIFSKPLILFMGPWSGGKSSIINYLLDNEFKTSSLRTGAEPSPAYFNILMWGEREEVLDSTQLAADWTFSGLQKFGQGLLDRLRGLRLNSPLLEKVNIVEIPGILEIRKQVERLFPFNDACQWFIDRADIIFLVYDPSKLDVGPETEAILDQLKGREYQTRIILNKADQVRPEELMRVQGTLIWNISPLMSSTEPPVMYSTSLWSVPYEQGAPSRLLHAQERAFLRDLRLAVDRRVENKIASARRFAVRVRNHAKMVDCYLTTYYNHKTFFGNRKKVADDITEHPQNYHIYEGLSTLTNISRYDLPDPEVYRDFFRLNAVYDFQRLSETCTYFRGCPINRLDVAIAYDLPELVGKYKKQAEKVLEAAEKQKGSS